MDQQKTYGEILAELDQVRGQLQAKVNAELLAAQPKIEAKQAYEKYDDAEITLILMKKNPHEYEYSSTDFLNLGKYRLEALLHQSGPVIFNHWDKKKKKRPDTKTLFIAPLLATYLQITYPIKTIRPLNYSIRDPGDMYYWGWDLGQYLPAAEIKFNEHVKNIYGDKFNDPILRKTYPNIRYETYIDRDDFTLDPEFIPVENALLWVHKLDDEWVIDEGENTPELYITSRIPVRYDTEATCPTWIKTLNTCLPGQQREITWLQEYVGYTLYRTWDYDRVILFLGEGDNGKTTILETLRLLFGKQNCSTIGLWDLCNGKWYAAHLYLTLANIDPDTAVKDLENTSKFKTVTGGDNVMGERKGKDPFFFDPYCKHYIGANKMPYCYDDTDAFYRRWFIIRFFEQFPVGDPRRDNQLPQKLEAELPGILNWALEGLLRLLKNNGFTDPPTTAENKSLWNRLSNPVYAFIYSDGVTIDGEGEYIVQDFYNDYLAYCEEWTLPMWNIKRVGKRMNHHFDFVQRVRTYNADSPARPWAWRGIRKTTPEDKKIDKPPAKQAAFETVVPERLQAQLKKVLEVIIKIETISGSVKDDILLETLKKDHKMSKTIAARFIGVLMKDGSIYMPRPGFYRRTD